MTKIASIAYTYEAYDAEQVEENPEWEGKGWINGRVTLDDGQEFSAGGGWVDVDGTVDAYDMADAGDVKKLAEALGETPAETIAGLQAHCPTTWQL